MFAWPEEETLDCQGCGTALRKLSAEDVKIVAENPYNFIRFCYSCNVEEELLGY